jgi:hypothetical protein
VKIRHLLTVGAHKRKLKPNYRKRSDATHMCFVALSSETFATTRRLTAAVCSVSSA